MLAIFIVRYGSIHAPWMVVKRNQGMPIEIITAIAKFRPQMHCGSPLVIQMATRQPISGQRGPHVTIMLMNRRCVGKQDSVAAMKLAVKYG